MRLRGNCGRAWHGCIRMNLGKEGKSLNNLNILGVLNEQARPQSFVKGVFKGGCL